MLTVVRGVFFFAGSSVSIETMYSILIVIAEEINSILKNDRTLDYFI